MLEAPETLPDDVAELQAMVTARDADIRVREHSRIRELNEKEALEAKTHDRDEQDQISFRHMNDRRALQIHKYELIQDYARQRDELSHERGNYEAMYSGHSCSEPEM